MTHSYFRRRDTGLARVLARISPSTGHAYSASPAKRGLDLSISLPLVVIVLFLIVLLAAVNKVLNPRRAAFFLQDRVGRSRETLRVIKVRSMVPSTHGEGAAICTAFGCFIRRYYLDELPQLLQVIAGRLTLVGIRVLPRNVYEGLAREWSPERFAAWQAMYQSAPLGLSGAHQVFRGAGKADNRRFHRDMFYARRASLGFDLYLLWRTLSSRDTEHSRAPHRTQSRTRLTELARSGARPQPELTTMKLLPGGASHDRA